MEDGGLKITVKTQELVSSDKSDVMDLPTINQDDDPAGGWNEMVNGKPPTGEDIPY
jgi:hypothetical protein